MRILYFHQHFSTPQGFTGTRSYEFAKALIKRGHTVTMVCGNYAVADTGIRKAFVHNMRYGNVSGINVVELKLDYSNSDNYMKRAVIFIKYAIKGIQISMLHKYDLIYATSTPLTAGIPGIISKLVRRKKFIFEVRDLWPELPKAMGVINNPAVLKLMDTLEYISYCTSDACIGLSPGIVHGIKSKVPSKRVALIPNGCDLNMSNGHTSPNDNDEFIVAFTGAHGLANGLDAVLDAAGILLKRNYLDIKIHFIGDGKMKAHLIDRAINESLVNCVFMDPMAKHSLFDYLQNNVSAGLMVLANIPAFYFGTSPNKFFDYISLGLPVINNYPGWVANLIEENQCGYVVPPNNPEFFADAIVNIRDNNSLKNKMGSNARKLAEQVFDRNLQSNKVVEFLESIV